MNFPHEQLPLQQISLTNFVATAQDCQNDNLTLLNLMLCGRHGTTILGRDFETSRRVSVNARMDATVPEIYEVILTRDYDSAIGITRNLPFTVPLAVFPVPPFGETLKKDNHLTYTMPSPTVSVFPQIHIFESRAEDTGATTCVLDAQNPARMIKIPLSRIPNTALGKVDNRHVTRIFFPKMYKPDESPAISQALLASLYNDHIRPAVLLALADHQSHWPIAYRAAYRLYQNRDGELHTGTVDVHPDALVDFCDSLLSGFQGDENFEDAFFVHELRGTKGRAPHSPDDPEERLQALNDVMSCIHSERINPNHWHIDVGLEIRHPGHVVQWLTNGHFAILKHILPSLTDDQVTRLTDSSYFYRDHVGHIRDFAGFRLDPHTRGQADGVSYINIYSNEKNVAYQLHPGIYSAHFFKELLPQSIATLSQNLVEMSRTFIACSGVKDGEQEASARMEIRVSLPTAMDVNFEIPEAILQNCLVSVTPLEWWMFKFYRVKAMNLVLRNFIASPLSGRAMTSSLTLGAAIVCLINGLNHRPGEDRKETELLLHCSRRSLPEHPPEVHDQEAPNVVDELFGPPVMYDHGLYFLSGIFTEDTAWRMGGAISLTLDQLAALYRITSAQTLRAHFGFSATMNSNLPRSNPARIPNRQHRVTQDVTDLPIPDEEEPYFGFRLKLRGVILDAHVGPVGDDIIAGNVFGNPEEGPANQMDMDNDGNHDAAGVLPRDDPDVLLSNIWKQFPHDVMASAPNKASATQGSYLLLSSEDRTLATHSDFQKHDFTGIFAAIQARQVSSDLWTGKIMESYFPKKGYVPVGRVQNFPRCQYYIQWMELMNRVPKKYENIVRSEVAKKFITLHWLPHPDSDRMWVTRRTGTSSMWIGATGVMTAPIIGINGKHCRNLSSVKLETGVADEDSDSSLNIVDSIL